jgi:hypothetical protein
MQPDNTGANLLLSYWTMKVCVQPSILQYPQLQIRFPKFSHLLPSREGSDMDPAIQLLMILTHCMKYLYYNMKYFILETNDFSCPNFIEMVSNKES